MVLMACALCMPAMADDLETNATLGFSIVQDGKFSNLKTSSFLEGENTMLLPEGLLQSAPTIQMDGSKGEGTLIFKGTEFPEEDWRLTLLIPYQWGMGLRLAETTESEDGYTVQQGLVYFLDEGIAYDWPVYLDSDKLVFDPICRDFVLTESVDSLDELAVRTRIGTIPRRVEAKTIVLHAIMMPAYALPSYTFGTDYIAYDLDGFSNGLYMLYRQLPGGAQPTDEDRHFFQIAGRDEAAEERINEEKNEMAVFAYKVLCMSDAEEMTITLAAETPLYNLVPGSVNGYTLVEEAHPSSLTEDTEYTIPLQKPAMASEDIPKGNTSDHRYIWRGTDPNGYLSLSDVGEQVVEQYYEVFGFAPEEED